MRQAQGRPTPAMQPRLRLSRGSSPGIPVNVLLHQSDPQPYIAQMRHIVQKTQDPRERYETAVGYLSATYYQRSRDFSDHLSALFALDSPLASQILEAGSCILDFEEKSQGYTIPCRSVDLPESDPQFQSTYWHNSMFNPALPGRVRVLSFIPDWSQANMLSGSELPHA